MPVVVLVGSSDRALEELLRQSAAVTVRAVADMSALAALPGDPDAVVLDLRRTPEVPPEIAAYKRQHAGVPVVIVARSLDPDLLLAAMRAGVSELVAEPVTLEQLTAALARVSGTKASTEAGQVFAFVGAKGGIGTTTVAVNVAMTLGTLCRPASTLLVDLHQASGDAAVFLGAEPKFSIADAVENTARLDHNFFRTLVTKVGPGLDLLASSERPVVPSSDAVRLRAVIAAATALYRFVVLDVPRADGAALDALDAATTIVIVTNQELATVRSASRLAARLRPRYGASRVAAMVNRVDGASPIAHGDVERAIGFEVAHMIPSDYRVALHALNNGRPLALDNHTELAGALKRVAYRLAGVQQESKARSSGLLGLLTQARRS